MKCPIKEIQHVTRSGLSIMVKPGSTSPEPPYTIVDIDFPFLRCEEVHVLPLPPTPPELIHDDSPSTHDYRPRVRADDPVLLAALEKVKLMAAFQPEEDDVDDETSHWVEYPLSSTVPCSVKSTV